MAISPSPLSTHLPATSARPAGRVVAFTRDLTSASRSRCAQKVEPVARHRSTRQRELEPARASGVKYFRLSFYRVVKTALTPNSGNPSLPPSCPIDVQNDGERREAYAHGESYSQITGKTLDGDLRRRTMGPRVHGRSGWNGLADRSYMLRKPSIPQAT